MEGWLIEKKPPQIDTSVQSNGLTYGWQFKAVQDMTIEKLQYERSSAKVYAFTFWEKETSKVLYSASIDFLKAPDVYVWDVAPITLKAGNTYAITMEGQLYFSEFGYKVSDFTFDNYIEQCISDITGVYGTSGKYPNTPFSTVFGRFNFYAKSTTATKSYNGLIPPMTSNTAPAPYTASASSFLGGTYEAFRAFERTDTYGWFPGIKTGWLQIDLGKSKRAVEYHIKSGGVADRNPKDWALQGSNDNAVWNDLDTQVGVTSWNSWEEKTFNIGFPGQYRYYRINVTANNGNAHLTINQWQLYEDEDTISETGIYLYSTGAVAPNETKRSEYVYSAGTVVPNPPKTTEYLYSNTVNKSATARSLSIYDSVIIDNVQTKAKGRSLAAYDSVALDNVQTKAVGRSLAAYGEVENDPAKVRKIALIEANITSANALTNKAVFEEYGHTVTLFQEDTITSSNLGSYDLIVTRGTYNKTAWQDIVIGYMQAGKPVLMGFQSGLPQGESTVGLAIRASLAQRYWLDSSKSSVSIIENHEITNGFIKTNGYSIYKSGSWLLQLRISGGYQAMGRLVASDLGQSNYIVIDAIEKGTARLDKILTGARAVFIGFLNGSTDYTADGKQLIQNAVLWATAPPPETAKAKRHVIFI